MFSYHSVDNRLYALTTKWTSQAIKVTQDSSGNYHTFIDQDSFTEQFLALYNKSYQNVTYSRDQNFYHDGSSRGGQIIVYDYFTTWSQTSNIASTVVATSSFSSLISERADGTNSYSISSSAVTIKPYAGITSAILPVGFFTSQTQTYEFTTTFSILYNFDPPLTISATGSGTTINTTPDFETILAPNTAYLFVADSMLSAEMWLNSRFNLPPLRQVAGHLHAPTFSGVSQGDIYSEEIINFGISEFAWAKTLISSSISVSSIYTVISYTVRDPFDPPPYTKDISTLYSTLSEVTSGPTITVTTYGARGLLPYVYASRKIFASLGFVPAGVSGEVFSSYSANPPDVSAIPSFFVSIFNGVVTPRIFTTTENGFLIDGSSAIGKWIWTNGDWSLCLTKLNETTSSSLIATIQMTGSNSITEDNAVGIIGNTSVILGPAYPVAFSGLNAFSGGISASGSENLPFYIYTAPIKNSWSEQSSFFPSSGSFEFTLGSATDNWKLITYQQSKLTGFKAIRASSYNASPIVYGEDGYGFTAGIPAAQLGVMGFHLKYNEAGRIDNVAGWNGLPEDP